MVVQCWASVVDGGPTLSQHWSSVSCLLEWCCHPTGDIGPMLVYSLRRWPNIEPALEHVSCLLGWCCHPTGDIGPMMVYSWASVCYVCKPALPRPLLTKRSPNAGSTLGQRRRRWTNIEPALSQALPVCRANFSQHNSSLVLGQLCRWWPIITAHCSNTHDISYRIVIYRIVSHRIVS